MLLTEKVINLNKNISIVYPFVTNMENYNKWFPGVVSIRSSNDLAHGEIGKQYIETLHLPEGVQELTIEVKKSIKNEFFETEGDLEPLLPRMTMQFIDLGENLCQLKLSYRSRNTKLSTHDKFIVELKNNLNERINIAAQNLQNTFC